MNIFRTPDTVCVRNTWYYLTTQCWHYRYLHFIPPGSEDFLVGGCQEQHLFPPDLECVSSVSQQHKWRQAEVRPRTQVTIQCALAETGDTGGCHTRTTAQASSRGLQCCEPLEGNSACSPENILSWTLLRLSYCLQQKLAWSYRWKELK